MFMLRLFGLSVGRITELFGKSFGRVLVKFLEVADFEAGRNCCLGIIQCQEFVWLGHFTHKNQSPI